VEAERPVKEKLQWPRPMRGDLRVPLYVGKEDFYSSWIRPKVGFQPLSGQPWSYMGTSLSQGLMVSPVRGG
jgi:hypothetical protein